MWMRNCILRDKNKVKEFENKKLKIIFGCARELIKRDWRKLSNEKRHNFYISFTDYGTGATQKLLFGVNTTCELRSITATSDSISTFRSQNIPR